MKMFEEALIQKFAIPCFLTQEYINKIHLPLVVLISRKCIVFANTDIQISKLCF